MRTPSALSQKRIRWVMRAMAPRRGCANSSALREELEDLRGVVGEARALAAHEGHVPAVRPALEAIDHVREARGALGEVGRVDLRDVAEAHDLGPGPGARDQRLHLL